MRPVLAALTFLLCAVVHGADVGIGTSREEVLEQFGKPTSIARRGDHEIFLYPKGGRIEFVNGKVVDVKGTLPPVIAPVVATPTPASVDSPAVPQPAAEKSVAPPPPAKTIPAAAQSASKTPPVAAKPSASKGDSDDYNPAVAANELAKHVEKMDTPWGAAPEKEIVHSPLESVPSFLAGLLMRFGFTVLALKLGFKFWEMDAFWRGIFAIAGIDLVLHAAFELLGPATGGFTTMGAVENGIPGLVLIYTINRFCFNKRLQNAVVTAAAVKLVVTLCYIFAGVAALHALFG